MRATEKKKRNRSYVQKHDEKMRAMGIRRYALYIPERDADDVKGWCKELVDLKKAGKKKPDMDPGEKGFRKRGEFLGLDRAVDILEQGFGIDGVKEELKKIEKELDKGEK